MTTEEPDFERVSKAYELLQRQPGPAVITELIALAERGSLMSMIYLGWIYKRGLGAEIDPAQSEYWYSRAIAGGSTLAIYHLGHLYLDSLDYVKAADVFEKGASINYPPAMFCLGCMYLEGQGVSRDFEKARLLFKRAADQKNVFDKRKLAAMYLTGKYGLRDFFNRVSLFCSVFWDLFVIFRSDPNSDKLLT